MFFNQQSNQLLSANPKYLKPQENTFNIISMDEKFSRMLEENKKLKEIIKKMEIQVF